jgi:DNA polymerase III psi subunit
MLDERRRRYLEAMGISTWSLREVGQAAAKEPATEEPSAEARTPGGVTPRAPVSVVPEPSAPAEPPVDACSATVGIRLGPGRDGILLVCAGNDEPASRLASDIARALGAVPVWAWPGAGTEVVSIESAVEENLFTEVAVFGADLAASLFPGDVPAKVGAASILQLPSMAAIREQADSRRSLWNALCRAGMVKPGRR